MLQDMLERPFDILPIFAPLPKSMALRALSVQEGNIPHLSTTISFREQPIRRKQRTPAQKWALLYDHFQPLRQDAYDLTQKAIEEGKYSTEWMVDELTRLTPGKEKKLSEQTLSRWRSAGLFVYERDDWPDEDSSTALLTLRLLTKKKTNAWAPLPRSGETYRGQPLWHCWRQDGPRAPIIPCKVPLSLETLPEHALVWTDWIGADRKNDLWMRIGDLGCCRWAHVKEHNSPGKKRPDIIWDISERSLNLWGIDTSSYKKELERDSPLTLHTLANLALLKLSTERLEASQILTDALEAQLQLIA